MFLRPWPSHELDNDLDENKITIRKTLKAAALEFIGPFFMKGRLLLNTDAAERNSMTVRKKRES